MLEKLCNIIDQPAREKREGERVRERKSEGSITHA
jgi:hypothetical protein